MTIWHAGSKTSPFRQIAKFLAAGATTFLRESSLALPALPKDRGMNRLAFVTMPRFGSKSSEAGDFRRRSGKDWLR